MSGAPTLASKARCVLARAVHHCLPDKSAADVRRAFAEATSHPWSATMRAAASRRLPMRFLSTRKARNVLAIGPGLSRSAGALDFRARYCETPLPVVVMLTRCMHARR
jgi:NAD(P)H-hydrate repair Nnr-like enzyme with NAD(P)H-hydrate dehydratase domain